MVYFSADRPKTVREASGTRNVSESREVRREFIGSAALTVFLSVAPEGVTTPVQCSGAGTSLTPTVA